MFTTIGTYPWSFVTQIFHNGQPSHVGDRQTFKKNMSTLILMAVIYNVTVCYNIFLLLENAVKTR